MLSMDSEYIKREKFREAITTRLIQLSKHCDEICNTSLSPSRSPKKNMPDFQPIIEAQKDESLNFPALSKVPRPNDQTSNEKENSNMNASVSICPLLVNNFVSPITKDDSMTSDQNGTSNEQKRNSLKKIDILSESISTSLDVSQISVCLDELYIRDASSNTDRITESVVDRSECGSRLFATTPSTDLENYMDSCADTLKSHGSEYFGSDYTLSSKDSPESQIISKEIKPILQTFESEHRAFSKSTLNSNESRTKLEAENRTSLSSESNYTLSGDESTASQSDHITVVSMTSDTNSSTSEYAGEVLLERVKNSEVTDIIGVTTPDSRTPRRRRLSYTLDCPSPVLAKALENRSVGPQDNLSKHQSVDLTGVTILETNLPNEPAMFPVFSPKLSQVKKLSSPAKSRIPVITSQVFKPPGGSLVQASDDHFANLEMKNRVLREYLEKLPIRPASRGALSYPARPNTVSEPTSSRPTSRGTSPHKAQADAQLQSQLNALTQETAQQRHLLELQEQMLQSLAERQEQFFQQLQRSQQQLMAEFRSELSRQLQGIAHKQNQETKKSFLEFEDRFLASVQELRTISLQDTFVGTSNSSADNVDTTVARNVPNVHENLHSCIQSYNPWNAALSPRFKAKFNRLSAAVKGYLTRRLLKTEKVQTLIQTIKDTMECALKLQDVALHSAEITKDDAELHQRLINQVTSACYEFHDVFFKYPVEEQMLLISQSRQLAREKSMKIQTSNPLVRKPSVSAATLKMLERKKFGKCKSVSPTVNKKRWTEPKRSFSAAGFGAGLSRPPTAVPPVVKRTSVPSPLQSSLRVRDQRPKPRIKSDCRSPSFFN